MKIKLRIPTELKDIKLSQYQKFLKTTEGKEDQAYIERQMVAIFCDLPDDAVGAIKAKDYKEIVQTITKTLNQEHPLVTRFTYKGKEYGFIPNIEDITVGEKADIDMFFQDWQKMDQMISVCYRPITLKLRDKYQIEDYKEAHSMDVTMDVVIGCVLFFYNLMRDLLSYIPKYLEPHLEVNPKAQQILQKNGVGIRTFTQSLKEMFSDLTKLENSGYIKPYYT